MFGFGKSFSLTAEEFESKAAAGAHIIDVRTPQEFKQGHIKGASNIPLATVPMHLNELYQYKDKNEDILLYCHPGARSAQACYFLIKNNFTQVFDLKGGVGHWRGKLV